MRERKKRFDMRRKRDMALTSRVAKNGANAFDELLKAFFCDLQLLTSSRGQLVKFGFSVGFREGPLGADPPALLHSMERRIQRTLFYTQEFLGRTLDMPDDSVAVQLAHLRQRLEDQKVQTALKIISRHDD